MALLSVPIVPPVLRDVTELKVNELNRAKAALSDRYWNNEAIHRAEGDLLKRITALLGEIKKHDPDFEDDDDLSILERFLQQAKNDKSISHSRLLKFEKQLFAKFYLVLRRMEVSAFHVDLLKEELASQDSTDAVTAQLEKASLEDDFEVVEGELEAAFERFEKNAFTAKKVDVQKLESYLTELFQSDAGKHPLSQLRSNIEDYATEVMEDDTLAASDETVEWCIKDILVNRPLSDETRKTLSNYLTSPAAIRELKSTLNMKSIRHWNWQNADKGLPVTARQNEEGKYCIIVEEDIVDMLFLHALANAWCMKLKGFLHNMVSYTNLWVRNTLPSPQEMDKRDYYLDAPRTRVDKSIPSPPNNDPDVLPPPPPPPEPAIEIFPPPPPVMCPPPPPPPPPGWSTKPIKKKKAKRFGIPYRSFGPNLNSERCNTYMRQFFLSRLPDNGDSVPIYTATNVTQAEMIKHLATEAKLREALDGEVHGEFFNIISFASSMPHQTILTLLKFIGVPQNCLDMFSRFLQAPLNLGPLVRGTADQVVTRTNGVPTAHGMEIFFSELVLFFLDFAVHQKTGGYLHRIRDKCYFIGSCEQCENFDLAVVSFVKAMEFTDFTLDSLATPSDPFPTWPIGFVALGVQAGQRVSITIDMDKVTQYAYRVKKQLGACTTVISWVRTWNATIGTYAPHLFGPLVDVLGKPHLEAVTKAYNRIHEIIFDGGNLTKHMTKMLDPFVQKHSLEHESSAIEPLIFLPTAYGGLGVKNPYIALNLARKLPEDPNAELKNFLSKEKSYYGEFKTHFEMVVDQETRERKLAGDIYKDRHEIVFGSEDPHSFFSFSEFTKFREVMPYPELMSLTLTGFGAPPPWTPAPTLIHTYNNLLEEPIDCVDPSERVLDYLRSNSRGCRGKKSWTASTAEDKWVLQLYSDECFEKYGGLEMWWSQGVPLEALKLVRGEEEDDEYIDDMSVSDMTEP